MGTPQDGWKRLATSPPAGREPAPATSRRAWQPGAAAPKTTGRRTNRAGRLIVAGVVVGLLTAVVAALALWFQLPKYAAVVVVSPNAVDSLAVPENAAGAMGAGELADWCREGGGRPKLAAGPTDTAARDAWKGKLDGGAKATVLYLAAHGGADATGPYLWFPPINADAPLSDADKLPVKAILDRLAELPPNQPKLLVFDLARTPPNWTLGGAFADFARALAEMDADIHRVDGLAVIASNDADQVSWAGDDLRATAFGHFFAAALQGAGHQPNEHVTAASAFAVLAREVPAWADAQRNARQTPLLLPKVDGPVRASLVELAAVPSAGYSPPAPASPAVPPAALAAEWTHAAALAARSPGPDSTAPLKWREYLDALLRWERLARLGADGGKLPTRVPALRQEVEAITGGESAAGSVALPAAAALGVRPADLPAVNFEPLWSADTRAAEWDRLRTAHAGQGTAVRAAVVRFVLDKVLADTSEKADALAPAEDVFALMGEPAALPAEAHFLRMLHRHLHPTARPPGDLVRTAVRLRVQAEQAAWPEAYPEQAARWTAPLVEAADAERQKGEDLLFDVTADSWARAAKHFDGAKTGYTAATERGRTLAAALALRDRTLARLPYYARWLADYRGPLSKAQAAALTADADAAAVFAQEVNRLTAAPPAEPAKLGERFDEMRKLMAGDGPKKLGAVEAAHRDELAGLPRQAQESNWHALDGALAVPFGDTARATAAEAFVKVGASLAAAQRTSGTPPPAADTRAAARRHLRAAALLLGEPADTFADAPNDPTWWATLRAASDAAGKRFRDLPAKASVSTRRLSENTAPLADAAPDLSAAALAARRSDPAAAVGGTPAPPLTERLYWRHRFLLWQAERATRDGWCGIDPTEKEPARWYCGRVAATLVAAARADIAAAVPSAKRIEETTRLFAECVAQEGRKPTAVTIRAPGRLGVVQDDADVPFAYTVGFDGDRVGFPVVELKLPPPLDAANADLRARLLEPRLTKDVRAADTELKLKPGPRAAREEAKAEAAVLYRGRRTAQETAVAFSGPPTLRWVHTPPTGPAAMALTADKSAVGGAVTILIDLSGSMGTTVAGTGKTRLEEALAGVERLLAAMPDGTRLTVAGFYGRGVNTLVEPVGKEPFRIDSAIDQQRRRIMDQVGKLTVQDQAVSPIADGIRLVLADEDGKFWPPAFSGRRTLIVLTDGEDNPGVKVKERPHEIVLAALKGAKDDVNLHMVFFAMTATQKGRDEEDAAVAEFKPLTEKTAFGGKGRTPVELYRGVKDGEDFASRFATRLKDADRPRLRYAGGREAGTLVATTARDVYDPSAAVPKDSYALTGGGDLPDVQLDPGDRVLLRMSGKGGRTAISIPPTAHELAAESNGRVPHAAAGDDRGTTVYLALPELTGTADRLRLTATLEASSAVADPKLLRLSRPLVAWFDVANPDGAAPPDGLSVTVENRPPGLLAPAWDIILSGWDANRPGAAIRPLAVTAHWVDGLPPALGVVKLDLTDLPGSADAARKQKAFSSGGADVELLSAAVEDREGGRFLVARLRYGKPGDLVFARGTGWAKGEVGARHSYYDAQARYTVEFGPLTAADEAAAVRLELYSVAAMRAKAAAAKRSVRVDQSFAAAPWDRRLPDELKLTPKAK